MAVPTPEPIALLGAWHGDSRALEQGGDFVTTGLSVYGDGVYRVDDATAPGAGLRDRAAVTAAAWLPRLAWPALRRA